MFNKKIFVICIAMGISFSLTSCSGDGQSLSNVSVPEQNIVQKTPIEELSVEEKKLFDAMLKMFDVGWYSPSTARVLQVADYEDNVKWKEKSPLLYGPDTVVLKIQGTNQKGGTVTSYYELCITEAKNTEPTVVNMVESTKNLLKYDQSIMNYQSIMHYEAVVGQYIDLESDYSIKEDASSVFSVSKINNALKYHWDQLGVN